MAHGRRWRELEELTKHTFNIPIDDSDASDYDAEDEGDDVDSEDDESTEDDLQIIDSGALPGNASNASDMAGEDCDLDSALSIDASGVSEYDGEEEEEDLDSEDDTSSDEDLPMKSGKALVLGKVAFLRELNADVSFQTSRAPGRGHTTGSKRSTSGRDRGSANPPGSSKRARIEMPTASPSSQPTNEESDSILGLPHPEQDHENYLPWPKENTRGIFIPWPLFGSKDIWPQQATEENAPCPQKEAENIIVPPHFVSSNTEAAQHTRGNSTQHIGSSGTLPPPQHIESSDTVLPQQSAEAFIAHPIGENSNTPPQQAIAPPIGDTQPQQPIEAFFTLPKQHNRSSNIQWEWDDKRNFTPTYTKFLRTSRKPGISGYNESTPQCAYFKHFFTHGLVKHIVKETNRNGRMRRNSTDGKDDPGRHSWYDTFVEEMYTFLGMALLMGVVKKPSYKSYWSTDPMLHTPVFQETMSIERFRDILTNLHFYDIGQDFEAPEDAIRRIRPVFDWLRNAFRCSFEPNQRLVMEESSALWNGNSLSGAFIPKNKRSLKLFMVYDYNTRYIQDLILCTGVRGVTREGQTLGKSAKGVQTLGKSTNEVQMLGKSTKEVHTLGKSTEIVHTLGKSTEEVHTLGKSIEEVQALWKVIHQNQELWNLIHKDKALGKLILEDPTPAKSTGKDQALAKSTSKDDLLWEFSSEGNEFVAGLLNKRHLLYVNNWSTCPVIHQYLYSMDAGVCGIVKSRFTMRLLGNVKYYTRNKVLAISWLDGSKPRERAHQTEIEDGGIKKSETKEGDIKKAKKRGRPKKGDTTRENQANKTNCCITKPDDILNNKYSMCNKPGPMITSVDCGRREMKWYLKLFFHLLDIAVHNAHVLHQLVTGRQDTLEEFVVEVCRQLFHAYGTQNAGAQPDGPLRLTAKHFAYPLERLKFCHVCYHTTKRKQVHKPTGHECRECDVALCFPQCFTVYHTEQKY